MDQLIPVIDQIREVVASANLPACFKSFDLPQVAVVGGQSVGKSSILEAIVGRSFLPTGSGVVTRRPLVLRLVDTRETGSDREWGEFQHRPRTQFDNFNDIRDEIISHTERVCGSKHTISSIPIYLTISSPKVVNLTLVDLPGIARNPVGDQPQDIEAQIRNLVLEYLVQPRCILLAVIAGNADVATSDALALAREVDPQGERTIGVVTKLDLVDHGRDLLPVLDGRVYPLKLGFVGVACRRGEAGAQCRFEQSLEEQFFRGHPLYGSIASRCGTKVLAKNLNRILLHHIRSTFPDLKAHTLKLIHEHEVELQNMGECASSLAHEQAGVLLGLFETFASRFSGVIDGKLSKEQTTQVGHLVGRARIDFIFRDVFTKTVEEFNCLHGLTDNDIRVVLQNAAGTWTPLLFPEAGFELLVKRQIAKLEAPSLQCAELIFQELQRVLGLSQLPEFRRFVNLRDRIFGVTRGILDRCYAPACQMIKDRIEIELAYINTNHPDFTNIGAALGLQTSQPRSSQSKSATCVVEPVTESTLGGIQEVVPSEPSPSSSGFFSGFFGRRDVRTQSVPPRRQSTPTAQTRSSFSSIPSCREVNVFKLPELPETITLSATAPSSRESTVVDLVKKLLIKYLGIVKKNIADSVQKIVMFQMVNAIKESIHRECVAQLYKEELFDVLLQESNDVQGQRSDCRKAIEKLRSVLDVMDTIKIAEL